MCFPITKIKIATLPTAKFIVTLMAENSLDIPNVQKALKKKKKKGKKVLRTNPKPRMTLGETSHAISFFSHHQLQMAFRRIKYNLTSGNSLYQF